MIAAYDPQLMGLLLQASKAKGPAAPKTGGPTLNVGALATNPQLLAAQLQAQNVQGQMQANAQGASQMRGGALELGARLLAQALLSGESKKANTSLAQATIQQRMGQAQQFFPNDPTGQLLYLADPESATKALATQYQLHDVRQGNTLVNAPPKVAGSNGSADGTFTAPIYGVNNDQPTVQGPSGMQTQPVNGQQGAMLPPSYQQQTAAAAQAEAARHNQVGEQQNAQALQVQQQQAAAAQAQAAAAQRNAATGAGQLGLGQSNSGSFAPPPGFIIGAGPK